jgi:mRNA interferase HicA
MKRRHFLAHIRKQGCQLIREGRRHSWGGNPTTGNRSAVPRHAEISDLLWRKICQDLGVAAP